MKQNEHIDKPDHEPGHITKVVYSKGGEFPSKRVPSAEEVFFTDLANRISALEERGERLAKTVIHLLARMEKLEWETHGMGVGLKARLDKLDAEGDENAD